jgi:NDP-sugar pyrophosphorylase family protein
MQALILAGGKGTRLRPLTVYTPKPIVPICNRSFLLYQIDTLRQAGITDITLSLSYQPLKIEQLIGDGAEHGVKIKYTVEPQPMGTAGAYKFAEELIREPTVVFNGDILTDLDLERVIAEHNERGAAATLVLAPVDNPSAYGLVETEADGRVRRFLEKPKPDEISVNTINAGTYVLEPRVLDLIPTGENYSFEYQLFPTCSNAASLSTRTSLKRLTGSTSARPRATCKCIMICSPESSATSISPNGAGSLRQPPPLKLMSVP